jgi:hypothetical protein
MAPHWISNFAQFLRQAWEKFSQKKARRQKAGGLETEDIG